MEPVGRSGGRGTTGRAVVTVDGGTTNTRIRLWRDGCLLASRTVAVGVRDTAVSGSKDALRRGLGEGLSRLLAETGTGTGAVVHILASGMITSPLGLREVPHLPAPVGAGDLAQSMVRGSYPGIIPRPFWFIPGVKNRVPDRGGRRPPPLHWEAADMMRGEETEVFGLLEHLGLDGPALFILPGSHTKFVLVDGERRIAGGVTAMGGEVFSALGRETILADALPSPIPDELDPEAVECGHCCARRVGLTRSCFTLRVMTESASYSPAERAGFLAGAVYSTDLLAPAESRALDLEPDLPVIIGGRRPLVDIFELLVGLDGGFRGAVRTVDGGIMETISARGALYLADKRGLPGTQDMAWNRERGRR